MKKILYILSVGHSGSTLLDMTLGQFSNVFSTGELVHLNWQLYREVKGIENAEGKCTCGKEFRECNYWGKILSEVATIKGVNVESLPEKVNLKYFQKLSYFEDSYLLKAQRAVAKRYPVYNSFPFIRTKIKNISNNNTLVYNSIFNVTNADFIVDSSKDHIRYFNLAKENKIFPIIIIRNINALKESKYVTNDFEKLKHGWLKYYNTYLLPLLLKKNDSDFHVMSYEKFIDNPKREIELLARKLNLDVSSFSIELDKSKYHLVAGNPMRYNKTIHIRTKQMKDIDSFNSDMKESGLSDFYLKHIIQ